MQLLRRLMRKVPGGARQPSPVDVERERERIQREFAALDEEDAQTRDRLRHYQAELRILDRRHE